MTYKEQMKNRKAAWSFLSKYNELSPTQIILHPSIVPNNSKNIIVSKKDFNWIKILTISWGFDKGLIIAAHVILGVTPSNNDLIPPYTKVSQNKRIKIHSKSLNLQ